MSTRTDLLRRALPLVLGGTLLAGLVAGCDDASSAPPPAPTSGGAESRPGEPPRSEDPNRPTRPSERTTAKTTGSSPAPVYPTSCAPGLVC